MKSVVKKSFKQLYWLFKTRTLICYRKGSSLGDFPKTSEHSLKLKKSPNITAKYLKV